MLTADMVRARRRGDTLTLVPLVPPGPKGELARAELMVLAERILAALRRLVGHTREDVDESLDAIVVSAQLKKLRDGLVKLALDACEFSAEAGDDARALRAELFAEAAARRMAANAQSEFSVEGTLLDFAARRDADPSRLRVQLYADLRSQHQLLTGPAMSAHALLAAYELGQAQAVLLRATEVRVAVSDTHAPTLRYLFHKLKFHGLMHTITPLPEATGKSEAARYAITLSGPLSLFQASTKYGLSLALALPALRACASFELEADVQWGPTRDPLTFTLTGGRSADRTAETAGHDGTDTNASPPAHRDSEPAERPEVEALLASFDKQESGYRVARAGEILNVPGLGVCVPDLTFTHVASGHVVHLEVLGFWSRDAVWKRVELARRGLETPIIFAVPARLRVSEQVLDEGLHASLYVFKSVIARKAVVERLEALRA